MLIPFGMMLKHNGQHDILFAFIVVDCFGISFPFFRGMAASSKPTTISVPTYLYSVAFLPLNEWPPLRTKEMIPLLSCGLEERRPKLVRMEHWFGFQIPSLNHRSKETRLIPLKMFSPHHPCWYKYMASLPQWQAFR